MSEVERRVGIIYWLDISSFEFACSRFLCLLATKHVQEEDEDIRVESRQLLFVFSIPFGPLCLELRFARELRCIGVRIIQMVKFFVVDAGEYKVNILYGFVRKMPIMLVRETVEGGGKFVGGGHLCGKEIVRIYLNQFLGQKNYYF